MPLTEQQIETRRTRIGGSDARRLAEGDAYNLWLEKKGLKEPENLDNVLPVQMGIWTEPHHIKWFADQNEVTINGTQVEIHEGNLMATVDAVVSFDDSDLFNAEFKHVNAFTDMETQLEKYWPQLQHILMVSDHDRMIFSVLFGTMKWEWQWVERDEAYIEELLSLELTFLEYLALDEWPGELPEPPAPPVFSRVVNMEEGNRASEWNELAIAWVNNKEPAKQFENAKKEIKKLIPDDAKEAHGFGIVATRAKNGAVTIKEKSK